MAVELNSSYLQNSLIKDELLNDNYTNTGKINDLKIITALFDSVNKGTKKEKSDAIADLKSIYKNTKNEKIKEDIKKFCEENGIEIKDLESTSTESTENIEKATTQTPIREQNRVKLEKLNLDLSDEQIEKILDTYGNSEISKYQLDNLPELFKEGESAKLTKNEIISSIKKTNSDFKTTLTAIKDLPGEQKKLKDLTDKLINDSTNVELQKQVKDQIEKTEGTLRTIGISNNSISEVKKDFQRIIQKTKDIDKAKTPQEKEKIKKELEEDVKKFFFKLNDTINRGIIALSNSGKYNSAQIEQLKNTWNDVLNSMDESIISRADKNKMLAIFNTAMKEAIVKAEKTESASKQASVSDEIKYYWTQFTTTMVNKSFDIGSAGAKLSAAQKEARAMVVEKLSESKKEVEKIEKKAEEAKLKFNKELTAVKEKVKATIAQLESAWQSNIQISVTQMKQHLTKLQSIKMELAEINTLIETNGRQQLSALSKKIQKSAEELQAEAVKILSEIFTQNSVENKTPAEKELAELGSALLGEFEKLSKSSSSKDRETAAKLLQVLDAMSNGLGRMEELLELQKKAEKTLSNGEKLQALSDMLAGIKDVLIAANMVAAFKFEELAKKLEDQATAMRKAAMQVAGLIAGKNQKIQTELVKLQGLEYGSEEYNICINNISKYNEEAAQGELSSFIEKLKNGSINMNEIADLTKLLSNPALLQIAKQLFPGVTKILEELKDLENLKNLAAIDLSPENLRKLKGMIEQMAVPAVRNAATEVLETLQAKAENAATGTIA